MPLKLEIFTMSNNKCYTYYCNKLFNSKNYLQFEMYDNKKFVSFIFLVKLKSNKVHILGLN